MRSLRVPILAAKTLGPSQDLEFMGIVLDSTRMEDRLPEDKLPRISQLLDFFSACRSFRLVDLQSLIGTLQFARKVMVPGRTFLQRMINLTRGVPSRFHHIRLNKQFQRDITMWKVFLTQWNGCLFFLDSSVTSSPDLELYTNTASTFGFGGILMGNGSKGTGCLTSLLIRRRGLALNGKSISLLLSLAPSGTPILRVNAFNFGATMKALRLLSTLVTQKLPG